MRYLIKPGFNIFCGFEVNPKHIEFALNQTNESLLTIPAIVYKNIDYKTTSAIIGSIFCHAMAEATGARVNPIEKGHPDIIPRESEDSSEEQLRNYPVGLEVKCTVGNITKGANLRAGQPRIHALEGITWQAHHQEVKELLALIWDFVASEQEFNYPKITAIFYANHITPEDWGNISGTQGRNTKVTGIKASGRAKLGQGWLAIVDDPLYQRIYQRIMKFST